MGTLTAFQKFRVHAALSEKVKLEISRDEALALARCLEERERVRELIASVEAIIADVRATRDRQHKSVSEVFQKSLALTLIYFNLVGVIFP